MSCNISFVRAEARDEALSLENLETREFVFENLEEATSLSEEALARTVKALDTLLEESGSISLPFVPTPSIPVGTVVVDDVTAPPETPEGIEMSDIILPAVPVLPTIGTVDLPNAPEFNKVAPEIDPTIPVPDDLDVEVPVAPVLRDVNVPSDFDVSIPDAPTLVGYSIPDAPSLELPTLDIVTPDEPNPSTLSEFTWGEVQYQSTLLDAAKQRLLEFVNGASTGLTEKVENAIWNRARERERKITDSAVAEVSAATAARGFSTPDGALLRVVQETVQAKMLQEGDLNRDIMIKQAELEQENFRFAFSTAIALESKLIDLFNQVQDRALDAAKFKHQLQVEIFNAQVNLFNAKVAVLGLQVEIFKARLEAELARIEVYKAELEGLKAIAQLNESLVSVYKTQIDAVNATVEVFKTQVSAAVAQIDAERARIDSYRAEVQAYGERVRAKTAEYQGYATRIQAEVSKVDAFVAQARAFESQSQAFSALVTAKIGEKEVEYKVKQQFPLEVYKTEVEAAQAKIQAEATRLNSIISLYDSEVSAYGTKENTKTARFGVEADVLRSRIQGATAQADVTIKAADSNLRAFLLNGELTQSNMRAAAQISGQLTAAALAARNISTSWSGSSSTSNSSSTSANVNESCVTSKALNVNYNVNSNVPFGGIAIPNTQI